MKSIKHDRLFGAALLGLSLLGSALTQGVTAQPDHGARVQNSPGMTIQARMGVQAPPFLLVQGRRVRAPNPRYGVAQSLRASTEKLTATRLVGYQPKSVVLEGFVFPGYHPIDYGCKGVGIVFSGNTLRGAVWGEGWPGLPHLCARLERR